MPEYLTRTLGATAVLAVSVGTVSMAWHFLGTQRRVEEAKPACDWSEQRVLVWLRNVGVTKETVSAFQRERIDGNVLRSLTEQDIQLLSATSRDSEMICGALRDAGELSSMGALLKQTQSLFSQLAANRMTSTEERIHELQSILYAFKSFQRLPPEQQASALLKMSKQVSEVLAVKEGEGAEKTVDESVRASGSAVDEKVESGRSGALVQNAVPPIMALMVRLKTLFSDVKSEMDSTTPIENRLDRIHEMIRELNSIREGAHEAEESDLRNTLLSVSTTVGKLLKSLLELGEEEQQLHRRGYGMIEGSVEGREGDQQAPRSLGALIAVLSKVFELSRSDEFQRLPESARARAVQEMLTEVRQVKGELETHPGSEKEHVLQELVDPLLMILSNLESGLTSRHGDFSEDFMEIRRFLMELANVVNSAELKTQANDTIRERVVQNVTEHLAQVEGMLDTLPSEERAAALKMMLGIRGTLKEIESTIKDYHPSLSMTRSASGNTTPSADLPKRIMTDIQGVVKFMQGLSSETMGNADERDLSFRRNLAVLSTARSNALTLGAPGNPFVVLIDELVDGLQGILSEEKTEELGKQEDEEQEKVAIDGIDTFMRTLQGIQQRIPHCETIADIKPLRDVMGRVLTTADQCGIPWRQNTAAQNAMILLQDEIDKFIAEHKCEGMQNGWKGENEGWNNFEVALQAIQQTPPQTLEELLPYYSILEGALAQEMNEDRKRSVDNLRTSALSAMRKIYGLEGSDPIGGSQGLIENLNTMSNTLCDAGVASQAMLDDFEMALNLMPIQSLDPKVIEAMNVIHRQIQLMRDAVEDKEDEGDELEKDSDSGTSEEGDEKEENDREGGNSESGAEKAMPPFEGNEGMKGNVNSEKEASTQTAAEDPAVIERYLSLFPRIEAHVSLSPEEFATTCTPFDLNFIKLVLKRLETTSLLSDETLRKRALEAQKKLAAHLGESGELSSGKEKRGAPLHVTATETTSSSGQKGLEFVICTEEEAGKQEEDVELKTSLVADIRASEQPSEADRARWDGQSLAILLNDQENTKEEQKSVSHELSVLDDALVQNGFTVVDASPSLQSRKDFENMLQNALRLKPNRLFVFRSSRKDSDKLDTIRFTDGTVINLGEVMQMTWPTERTVLASCHSNRLDMNYRRDSHTAPAVAVQLTPNAVADLRHQRCAIFDGIFTPLVASFLGEEREQTMCPEDLIRSVVSATSSVPCVSGMKGGPAGMMGYFH